MVKWRAMRALVLSLWLLALGAIVLYGFFFGLAGVSPRDVAGVTVVVAVLAVLFTLRNLRVDYQLRSRAGNPQLRADRNRVRERRGF